MEPTHSHIVYVHTNAQTGNFTKGNRYLARAHVHTASAFEGTGKH